MELFNNGVIFFVCAIEVFLLYDYFSNFFELRIKKEYTIYILILSCVCLFGISKIGNASVNLVAFPLFVWLFSTYVFDSKIGVRIVYATLAYTVMIGAEFLYAIIWKITADMVMKWGAVPIYDYIWQTLFVKFINFIIFLLLKQTSGKSHSKMTNKLFFIYLIVPIATLGTMLTVFYSGVDFENHNILRLIMTVFFICMIIGNMMLFYAFQKHTEDINEAARQEIEIMHKNAEIYRLKKTEMMKENFNETVHNMSHSLKAIEKMARDKETEEIIKIVEEMTDTLTKRAVSEYSNNKMLNTIISEYEDRAVEKKVNFDVYVEPGCVLNRVKDVDLVSIMGNVLDNAMEATYNINNPSINFRMFMHDKGKMCIIKVVNDYDKEPVFKDGKLKTSKKSDGLHGIGVSSVIRNVEKYNGTFTYYTEDKKFHAILILPTE